MGELSRLPLMDHFRFDKIINRTIVDKHLLARSTIHLRAINDAIHSKKIGGIS
jgi:hypothetical protein